MLNMTHLYRGAPPVRSWSKYQRTIDNWTLCGIRRMPDGRTGKLAIASEDPGTVNCLHCLELMRPTGSTAA